MYLLLGEYLITAQGGQISEVIEIKAGSAVEAEEIYLFYRSKCGPGGDVQIIANGGKIINKSMIALRAKRERERAKGTKLAPDC